jgi:hypothetical protein
MPGQDPAHEELQVRQTAQRLLVDHLRRPPQISGQDAQLLPPSPQQAFWPGISLDLTGTTLIDFNFKQGSVVQARFGWATFRGSTVFAEAVFQGSAVFTRAICQGSARFYRATFQSDVWFNGTTFRDDVTFGKTDFRGGAWFTEADFQSYVGFYEATFHDSAWFLMATFESTADAEDADGLTRLTPGVAGAHVLRLNVRDPSRTRRWPDGYTVRPDPADPTRGTLIQKEQAKEPEQAIPPSDSTGP